MDREDFVEVGIENHFPIGQKLSIYRIHSDDNENYPSYVKDLSDDTFFIDMPSRGGLPIAIYENDLLEVAAITKEGILVGESVVVGIEAGRVSGVWTTYPEVLKKIQRREFMRWEFKFPVKVFVPTLGEKAEMTECECANLSGGGIAVYTKTPFLKRSRYKVQFQYYGIELNTKVRLVHVQFDPIKKIYLTGFHFLDVDKKLADKIHKMGLSIQLESRRKGIL